MVETRVGSTLMCLIHSLSAASDSGEEREEEKNRLESRFRDSDNCLEDLVIHNRVDLTLVTKSYATVSRQIGVARRNMRKVKSELIACRQLLHYKRDELKRLWLDGFEQKHVLLLLEKIETIKECPDQIELLISQKKFIEATKSIVQHLNSLENELKNVEGLTELRAHLLAKKEVLYKILLDDMLHQLHVESTFNILKLRRHTSVRDDNHFQRSLFNSSNRSSQNKPHQEPSFKRSADQSKTWKSLMDHSNSLLNGRLLSVSEEEEWMQMLENPLKASLVFGPANALIINVECLSQLNLLPRAIEQLRLEICNELQSIVRRTTKYLFEHNVSLQEDNYLFSELFNAMIEQFYLVVDGYRLLSIASIKASNRNNIRMSKVDTIDVWTSVQSTIQMLLTDYLVFKDKDNSDHCTSQGKVHFSTEPLGGGGVNYHFLRKKNQRVKKSSLFKFGNSSTALGLNDYLREQRNDSNGKNMLVCAPNPHNITIIYASLMEFINEIEKSLKYDSGEHCTLYTFLTDFVKDVFLFQINFDNMDDLNTASNALDIWEFENNIDTLKSLESSKPILVSAIVIKKSVDKLYKYMNTLFLYGHHFFNNICKIMIQYKEICQAAFDALVRVDGNLVTSALLANDKDLSQLMTSFPVWNKNQPIDLGSLKDVELMSKEELILFRQKLGKSNVTQNEIISDPSKFKHLAMLSESLEWFSENISGICNELNKANLYSSYSISEKSIQKLNTITKDFGDLSRTCLLVLHIEVRIHCIYFLSPIWFGSNAGTQFQGGPESTDPSSEIIRLAKDLTSTEDIVKPLMGNIKSRYVFEGLLFLIGSILISSVEHIKRINSNGIKKMSRNLFTLQYILSCNIAGHGEVALEHAKQYLELLDKTSEEIMNSIVEKGSVFTYEEYENAIKLLHRSNRNSVNSETISYDLKKLKDVMKFGA
ncbi:exocyst complex component 4 [Lepeophtheirus salmonis]|uniref:exocyst complex component 4 n=1 Tax=Lepeophtheirus salmonis TaxID=72036 RepID=UPI001AEB89BE|nr:exocyst complex component 4-like [Lepeophtheirus salmonis]